jgi:hypothetical protein
MLFASLSLQRLLFNGCPRSFFLLPHLFPFFFFFLSPPFYTPSAERQYLPSNLHKRVPWRARLAVLKHGIVPRAVSRGINVTRGA